MLVPNKAEHKANAEALMNYYYDPEVAATLAAWVNYICPVEGAREAMEKIDPSLVDAPLIFPDEEFLSQTFSFMAIDDDDRQAVRHRLLPGDRADGRRATGSGSRTQTQYGELRGRRTDSRSRCDRRTIGDRDRQRPEDRGRDQALR